MKNKLLLIAIFIFVFLMLKNNIRKKVYTIQDAENAIKYAAQKYGKPFAKQFEQLLRLETNHFRSDQYINTGTGGMMIGAWGNRFKKAKVKPQGVWETIKNGKKYAYVVLGSVKDFADVLFSYLKDHDISEWNGGEMPDYKQRLEKISTPITDKL